MMLDYHIHTPYSFHAQGDMNSFVEYAYSCGLREMGFSDHMPIEHPLAYGWTMTDNNIGTYVDEVRVLREKWKSRISIKLGFEADFIPGYEDTVRRYVTKYEPDYIIGSVHILDTWVVDAPESRVRYEHEDIEQLFIRYFKRLEEAVRSGLFDIVGHPDLIKKFGYFPMRDDYSDVYDSLISAMKECDIAFEFNTSGLRKPVKEAYPAPAFLKKALHAGIPVITSSDAHSPEDVAADFEYAYRVLHELGVRNIAVFSQRQRSMVPLEDI